MTSFPRPRAWSARCRAAAGALLLGVAGMVQAAQLLPADGAHGVSRVQAPRIVFRSARRAREAARRGISLRTPVGSAVPGVLRVSGADVMFEPATPLADCTTYTLLPGGARPRVRFTTQCSTWTPPLQIDDRRTARLLGRGADDVQLARSGRGGVLAAWSQSNGRRGAVEASRLRGDTGTWDAPRSIDARGAGASTLPALATLADGRVLAAWIQEVHGHAELLARVLGGAAEAAPQRLDQRSLPRGPEAVQLAADAAGDAVAVWQQPGRARGAVWAAHWDARHARWSRARRLDPRAPAGYAPVVAGAADDRFAVAWERGTAGHERIAASRWLGDRWSPPHRLSPRGVRARHPLIALDDDGQRVGVAWIQGDGAARRIDVRRLRLSDWRGGAVRRLNARSLDGAAVAAALAFDPAGNLALAWEQAASPGDPDVIEATRWLRDASAPGSAVRLDPAGQRSAGNPVLVADAAGNLVCAWYQDSAHGLQVLAARFDASGARWQPALLLSDPRSTVQASFPTLTVDAAGSVTAAWQQFNGWRDIIVASRLP